MKQIKVSSIKEYMNMFLRRINWLYTIKVFILDLIKRN